MTGLQRALLAVAVTCAVTATGAVQVACARFQEGAAVEDGGDAAVDSGAAGDAGPQEHLLYIFGGASPEAVATFKPVTQAYVARVGVSGDIVGDWAPAPAFDIERSGAASATRGTEHFLLNGLTSGTPYSTSAQRGQLTVAADAGTGAAWLSSTASLVGSKYAAAAVSEPWVFLGGGKITVAGKETLTDAVDRYDTKAQTWKTAGKLSDPLAGHAMTAVGSKLYVVGGDAVGGDTGTYLPKVSVAAIQPDGAVASFTSAGGALPAGTAYHALAAVDRWLYTLGGAKGASAGSSTVLRGTFDAAGQLTWETNDSLSLPLSAGQGLANGCAVVIGRTIYMLGGRGDARTPSASSVLIADVGPNGDLTWRKPAGAMPFGRSSAGCAVAVAPAR